jgi:hypothetical protein
MDEASRNAWCRTDGAATGGELREEPGGFIMRAAYSGHQSGQGKLVRGRLAEEAGYQTIGQQTQAAKIASLQTRVAALVRSGSINGREPA